MKKNMNFFLSIIIFVAMLITGCAPAQEVAPVEEVMPVEEVAPVEEGEVVRQVEKICMILPCPATDGSWCELGYNALLALGEEFDVETAYQENVQPTDFTSAFRDFASDDCDVVIGHGSEFNPTIAALNTDYPDVMFHVFGETSEGGNMAVTKTNEAHFGFMPGFIAGKMTETNKVGVVGGLDLPGVIAQVEGFAQGVEYANPANEVTITYIGSMEDVAKAKETALALIDAGNDVLFHVANVAGTGVLAACEERDVYCIGFGADQRDLAPGQVLTSVASDVYPLYSSAVAEWISGVVFEPDVVRFGLDAPFPPITRYDTDLIPEEVLTMAREVEQMIADGLIVPVLYYEKQQ